MSNLQTENTVSFFDTVNGGPVGYLHRCSEQIRMSGIDPNNVEAVRAELGDEVYSRMIEAISIIKDTNA